MNKGKNSRPKNEDEAIGREDEEEREEKKEVWEKKRKKQEEEPRAMVNDCSQGTSIHRHHQSQWEQIYKNNITNIQDYRLTIKAEKVEGEQLEEWRIEDKKENNRRDSKKDRKENMTDCLSTVFLSISLSVNI